MTEFSSFIHSGANVWFFIPTAIFLGALHGLEPGHSKTMMAAFIVAIRGTVAQAVLLGLSATLSHTAIIWLLALPAAYFGSQWNAEASEPYFQFVSGLLILVIAIWMLIRTWRHQHQHHHLHEHNHGHAPKVHSQLVETGHGVIRVETLETDEGWQVRIHPPSPETLEGFTPDDCRLKMRSANGTTLTTPFQVRNGFIQSAKPLPVSPGSSARVTLICRDRYHDFPLALEPLLHGPEPVASSMSQTGAEELDPHAMAHARDIRQRFANRDITTGQIILFGLTGGLIPCSAAVAVLLMCLQLKRVLLGAVLVLSFSIGLALTLILSGTIAAVGVRQVTRRWSGFESFARKAPYFSGTLIILVGLYIGYHGLRGILD